MRGKYQRELGLLAFAVTFFVVSLMVAETIDKATIQQTEQEAVVIEIVEPVEVEEIVCSLVVKEFYDVPLDMELQAHIINECGAYDIDPAIVFAMIERESSFRADVVGDSGKSYGLMQIQKRWHEDRMERLGVTDLLDPYQNTSVGIDYLAEMLNRGNGVEWGLAAYNAGASGANKGYGDSYAKGVLERSEEMKVVTADVLLQR